MAECVPTGTSCKTPDAAREGGTRSLHGGRGLWQKDDVPRGGPTPKHQGQRPHHGLGGARPAGARTEPHFEIWGQDGPGGQQGGGPPRRDGLCHMRGNILRARM